MAEADNLIANSDDLIDTTAAIRRLVASDATVNAITADAPESELNPAADAPESELDPASSVAGPVSALEWKKHEVAILEWKKRESAIGVLYGDFCNSDLVTVVRLADGTLLQLASWEWREPTLLWHDTIVSGVVRASAGSRLAPYDGCPVFIKAFENWLSRRAQSKQPKPSHEAIEDKPVAAPDQTTAPVRQCIDPPTEEPTPPDTTPTEVNPTSTNGWIMDEARRMKAKGEIPDTVTAFAKKLAGRLKDALEKDPSLLSRGVRLVGWKYIKNHAKNWEIWPSDAIK
jgi:hypothetical protein